MPSLMDVYEPRDDSFLLQKLIQGRVCGRVLDMGCGSGVLTVEAAKHAGSILAADINPNAVEATKHAAMNLKNVEIIESNLFSNVKPQAFDIILFNPPYLPDDPEVKDTALDGGKKGYELTLRFLNEAIPFLTSDGEILLLFSTLTGKKRIEQEVARLALVMQILEEKKLFFEKLYVVSIRRSPLRKHLESKSYTEIALEARGKRGIVYSALKGKKKVAIKVSNPKSEAINRIENEALWLKKLNEHHIGPKLFEFHQAEPEVPAYIIMEFVEGKQILDFLEDEKVKKADIEKVIRRVMKQLLTLDGLQVNKEEMHWPIKHIIIPQNNSPTLIDFERCRKTERPKNVTQFCQFLSSERVNKILADKGIALPKQLLREASTAYAKGNKETLLEMFNL